MSKLYFDKKILRGSPLGAPSTFPAMKDAIKTSFSASLSEQDNLLIGYGMIPDPLPYTMLDSYESPVEMLEFDSAVLENEFLKAEIIPALGGRLWSLYDKKAGRDLIIDNTNFMPGNLGIRNAWSAGGVEWNIGRRGHDAQTCTPRFCARLKDDDGTPVLRIYEFNRDRSTPFQLDFFLPENSRNLFVRVRIMNPGNHVAPMYWWSNVAVEEAPGQRIIVPAMTSYANRYDGGKHSLREIELPFDEGFDCTYPCNFWNVKDHFYNIPDSSRKFQTVIFPDGYGLAYCSTRKLQGRKLFVWGQSPGGQHWQRKLMPPGLPNYIEIQGGICKTQMESMPMPPNSAWEWIESYGAIQVEPELVFGDWSNAVTTITKKIDQILPQTILDETLERTRTSFALKQGEIVSTGSGWGALEELRRGQKMTEHLDFGTLQPEQSSWAQLLHYGRFENIMPPPSYMVQDEWFELIKKAPRDNWSTWYHLSLNYYHRQDVEHAMDCINHALDCERNPYTLHAAAHIYRLGGGLLQAAEYACEAQALCPSDGSLAKDVLKIILKSENYELLAKTCKSLDAEVQNLQMIRFLYASALAYLGKYLEAEDILQQIDPPDVREGENSISDLYVYIQINKAKLKGMDIDPADVKIPYRFDLRQIS